MRESQEPEPFETPAIEDIPGITRQHVDLLLSTDDEEMWKAAGMRQIVIWTIGRRSGREHVITLPYWLDENGQRVVVASFAGNATHPAWYHNLADLSANSAVRVRERGHEFWSDAEILDGDDYDATWAALTADRPHYVDYQARTSRRIPLVRLPESRQA